MWRKGNPSPLLVGIVVGLQSLWKSVWWFLRKLAINVPQDPVIPLLGIYPKDAQSAYKDPCSTMFLAALFLIARTSNQSMCIQLKKECGTFTQWSITRMLKAITPGNLKVNGRN